VRQSGRMNESMNQSPWKYTYGGTCTTHTICTPAIETSMSERVSHSHATVSVPEDSSLPRIDKRSF
jgi:hypothetical protein